MYAQVQSDVTTSNRDDGHAGHIQERIRDPARHNASKSMIRTPKVLVTLFMMFALILQASAGSACAIGCLLGTCGSKQIATVHQDHDDDHGSCCDHEKEESGAHDDHEGAPQIGSDHKDPCGCPSFASCNAAVPTAVQAARVQVPNIDLPVILPETLTLKFDPVTVPEPGHFGNDSSPPLDGEYAPDHGRAPPVV